VVRSIQDQVATIARGLEDVAAAAQAEAGRNRVVAEQLATVEADLAGIRVAGAEIHDGSESIVLSVREVLSGTAQIAQAAEEMGGAAAEAATAARQQARGSEDLAAAIEEIASLADELQHSEG
jgi:methyl-accepting chemotaxis protein